MSILFQKIKEGRYFLPNYISKEVRDLINRMLQPNPVKRIKLAELQQHRWYLHNLPPYLRQLSNQSIRTEQTVDMDIVNQLYQVRT
jgi:5'-AMP-activated protein kinase catalytic alpha subunit